MSRFVRSLVLCVSLALVAACGQTPRMVQKTPSRIDRLLRLHDTADMALPAASIVANHVMAGKCMSLYGDEMWGAALYFANGAKPKLAFLGDPDAHAETFIHSSEFEIQETHGMFGGGQHLAEVALVQSADLKTLSSEKEKPTTSPRHADSEIDIVLKKGKTFPQNGTAIFLRASCGESTKAREGKGCKAVVDGKTIRLGKGTALFACYFHDISRGDDANKAKVEKDIDQLLQAR